jgi:ribulose 1,5-bisphosphate carboxylase large subunit-like protein
VSDEWVNGLDKGRTIRERQRGGVDLMSDDE